jgi:ArsR family transcriptional regulator
MYHVVMIDHDDYRARAVAAQRFRALGDETRLRILESLVDGDRTVSELIELLDIGQSLVSHHLRILRDAGLVIDRREGRWAYYEVVGQALAAVKLTVYELEPIRRPGLANGTTPETSEI